VPAEREQPVICIPVYGAYDLFVLCLRSLLEHTPIETPLLVADDASPDQRIRKFLYDLEADGRIEHDVYYMRQPQNLGFVGNANAAFDAVWPGDPVLVNSDCIVSAGWLTGLQAAAYSASRVATSSTLTNHGTILSVPNRNRPQPGLPQDWRLDYVAARIRHNSLLLRPRIPTALGHCLYIRRSALELVGGFDEAFSPGYGEEVDFSERCLLHGLSHVVADDVFVLHRGGGTFTTSDKARSIQENHEALIRARYPFYHASIEATAESPVGPLARAIATASRALRGVSVTIDARILGPYLTGTQVVVLELIHALRQTGRVNLRVLVPPDLGDYARDLLADMPDVARLTMAEVEAGAEMTDVVHRPFQLSHSTDLPLLQQLGERVVITHLDLIAYENPGYFSSFDEWDSFRRMTKRGLAFADRVLFISHAAAREALEGELIDEGRFEVVYPGTNHRLTALAPEPRKPAGMPDDNCPFLLCLGTDYRHKNRLFALRMLAALRREHGWDGRLVLAGPHVIFGSSGRDEAEFLMVRPDLGDAVLDLPAVTEAEKAWLLSMAQAVIYPTIYEGFGLVPFEAAEAGVPCLFAPGTALEEVLPTDVARLVPWNPEASADRALDVIDGDGGEALVASIRDSAKQFTWELSAQRTLEAYEKAVESPARQAAAVAIDAGSLRQLEEYEKLRAEIGEDGMALVGPDGVLPDEMLRPLLAIATRGWLRRPVFGALRAPYRVAHWMRNSGSARETSSK
jgi:glycosyltransferase involved in cell wall biosynthesis